MEKIACAIVGLGRIGSLLEDDRLREKPASHAGAVVSHPSCRLAAGCDLSDSRRAEFAKRWRCPSVYSDCAAMLREIKPHILHVATPAETHRKLVELAFAHGVPLIICEKPLTDNLDDAKTLLEKSKESSSVLMINHERRYSRDYIHAKRIVESRDYGELLAIQSKVYMGRMEEPRTVLFEDGTHMIDILRFLTGEEIETIGTWGDPGEKGASLNVFCRCGVLPVFIEIGGRRDHVVFELDLSFEAGRIRIGNGLYEEYRSLASSFYEGMKSLVRYRRLGSKFRFKKTGYFSGMMRDAVAVLQNPKREPASRGYDGYKAVEVIDEILNKLR
jgi:predicted dehydrogenase